MTTFEVIRFGSHWEKRNFWKWLAQFATGAPALRQNVEKMRYRSEGRKNEKESVSKSEAGAKRDWRPKNRYNHPSEGWRSVCAKGESEILKARINV